MESDGGIFTGTLEELLNNDKLMAELSRADRDIPAQNNLSRPELVQIIADANDGIRRYQNVIENAIRRLTDG